MIYGPLALALSILAAATPPEAAVRACEQQAKATVGAPPVSPRDQPNASAPSDDTRQQGRSDPTPLRRQDLEARKTPPTRNADPHNEYRVAFEACVRARGY
jgi:hypothetical protein